MTYVMNGAKEWDSEKIFATHPALPGTYLCFARADGGVSKEVVILWAVLRDGSPEPITMDGVWGGIDQQNMFVEFPDGRCARFEGSWETAAEAIATLGQHEPQLTPKS